MREKEPESMVANVCAMRLAEHGEDRPTAQHQECQTKICEGNMSEYMCEMCKNQHVFGKRVDRSKPTETSKNPSDKLTSTVDWPIEWSKFCYFCGKKHEGLIRI
jgi:hypothetical protein